MAAVGEGSRGLIKGQPSIFTLRKAKDDGRIGTILRLEQSRSSSVVREAGISGRLFNEVQFLSRKRVRDFGSSEKVVRLEHPEISNLTRLAGSWGNSLSARQSQIWR